MIKFFRYGSKSSLLNEPNTDTVRIPVNKPFHITIDKSLVDCNWTLGVRQCGKINQDCTIEDVITKHSCLNKMDNDGMFYISLLIPDEEAVPSFRIRSIVDGSDMEIFEFAGGDKDDLITEIQAYRYGVEIKPYGLKIFFPSDYKGDTAEIVSDGEISLLSNSFCYNKTDKYGIDLCFKEIGCYNVVFTDSKGDIVTISNPIKVVNYDDKNLQVVEYYQDGFWHREMMDLTIDSEEFEVTETERTLTDGSVAISDTVIQPQSNIQTGLMTREDHIWLLSLLKSGVRINGRRVKLRGGYELTPASKNKYYGSGTVYYPDEVISSIKSCNTDCLSGSSLSYDIMSRTF